MTANELRQKFLKFFESKGHVIIPSASLVPENDHSVFNKVLFTTAGMQQFKEYYLNPEESKNSRIATIQKCLRTIDIEEVGDKTHLTFFEMLGNFSFGYPDKQNSYFKEETINYAWEFLTENLEINKKRIYATYFKGQNGVAEDIESLNILKKIKGLSKIVPQGFDDNFWSLGTENSPGGPTVEFYVDGIEVWNCVFNEYVLKEGKYVPSDKKGVDTGMGFERLLAVLNGKETIFETELFEPIIEKIEEISGKKYEGNEKPFRIISDHLKAATFIMADDKDISPSNLGQGYVVRRLIRRAIRYGKILGIKNESWTKEIAKIVAFEYRDAYSELPKNIDNIIKKLEEEEENFRKTLDKGLQILNNWFSPETTQEGSNYWSSKELTAKRIFDLYQTHGFPIELTFEELTNREIKYDKEEYLLLFNKELKKHQELSRTASAGMFKGGLADSSEETKRLHTAAHLLLAALRQVLGEHVSQKGSNITPERLRFDFSHLEKMTEEQIKEVEKMVNKAIQEDLTVACEEMSLDEATEQNAMGVFKSKYGEKVKVYTIGSISKEICGGPHVSHTRELGKFKITKEESSSAGVRRIKAILE
ncbi:MAG: alanine--tRNA ligase [Patescibacteria group bacterium]